MKTIKCLAALFISAALFQSCISAYGYDQNNDIYYETTIPSDISYSIVASYGTPFFIDGIISYYLYNNVYYYPYLWNNVWYLQPFSRPMHRGFVFRPGREHRPLMHMGDINHTFRPNYGNHHRDMGKHYDINTPNNSYRGMRPEMRYNNQPNSRPDKSVSSHMPQMNNERTIIRQGNGNNSADNMRIPMNRNSSSRMTPNIQRNTPMSRPQGTMQSPTRSNNSGSMQRVGRR